MRWMKLIIYNKLKVQNALQQKTVCMYLLMYNVFLENEMNINVYKHQSKQRSTIVALPGLVAPALQEKWDNEKNTKCSCECCTCGTAWRGAASLQLTKYKLSRLLMLLLLLLLLHIIFVFRFWFSSLNFASFAELANMQATSIAAATQTHHECYDENEINKTFSNDNISFVLYLFLHEKIIRFNWFFYLSFSCLYIPANCRKKIIYILYAYKLMLFHTQRTF